MGDIQIKKGCHDNERSLISQLLERSDPSLGLVLFNARFHSKGLRKNAHTFANLNQHGVPHLGKPVLDNWINVSLTTLSIHNGLAPCSNDVLLDVGVLTNQPICSQR